MDNPVSWRAALFLLLAACSAAHVQVSPYASELYRVGRFDDGDPAGPRFIWSASRFSLRFEGEAVVARLRQTTRPSSPEGPRQPLRVRAVLDGQPHELYADAQGQLQFEARGL